ncbi:MAG: glycosyltransferase family 2 protein [Clostridia bacterium]|nr:glycosyltransferase family 2 protein [Clostridia bacterium]
MVSIIIPVYNVEKYLKRCVDSVLNQTYKNIEIILVDDGSPDNCPLMCDEFAKTDPRIKVIHKQNGGLSSARLAGFKEAEGEYILFVDSDDYIEKDMVEKLVFAIKEKNADLVICGYYTQFGDRNEENFLPFDSDILEDINTDYILPLIGNAEGKISLPGFLPIRLLKKSFMDESFFVSENKYFAEDIVFDLLYSDKIQKIAVVNEPLYYYCINGQSLSNKYRKNKFQMLKNLYDFKKEFLSARNIGDDDNRLKNYITESVFVSVDNAVLSGSYSSFLKEIKLLQKDAKEIIATADKNPLHSTVSLTMFLLNLKAYFIIYLLRKSRLK